jgi:hypothetical protein
MGPGRDGVITIEVTTPRGTFLRTVQPASILPEGVERGPIAEAAIRGAAARYGLPDFVFHPATERRGAGVREIGDAIIVAGRRGLSLQVKARQNLTDDNDRERAWLVGRAEEGARQAAGTIRRLGYSGATRLENLRGGVVSIIGRDVEWAPLVVLDHPGVPDLVLGGDVVVLSRRDWEFLFEQLRSTVAVVDYIHRVRSLEPARFNLEAVRYYELAQADAATTPGPINPAFAGLGARNENAPLLPFPPAEPANLVRWILEDIAAVPQPNLSEEQVRHRLTMLATIDSAPIETREQMADTILRWFEQVQAAPPKAAWWRIRNYIYFGRMHLLIAVTNQTDPIVREAFGHLVRLRHIERGERSAADADITTVGVLLQPRSDGRRPWDTTAGMVEGLIEVSPEERAGMERMWGSMDEGAARAGASEDANPFEGFAHG